MNAKFLTSLAMAGLVLVLAAGCVRTVDGHYKAGMPFKKDKIECRYERTPAQIMSAARVVLSRNGRLVADNTVANVLQAKINQRTVWLRVTEIDPKVTHVTIQARGRMGTDLDVASTIDRELAIQLAVAE